MKRITHVHIVQEANGAVVYLWRGLGKTRCFDAVTRSSWKRISLMLKRTSKVNAVSVNNGMIDVLVTL